MPDMKELPSLLKSLSYKLEDVAVSKEFFFGTISGGKLGEVEASLRATGDLCNVGVIVGLLDSAPERARYSLLGQMLELNFDHPLAHTSLVQAPVQPVEGSSSDEPDRITLIVAESSFFWPNTIEQRLDARMTALYAIAFAASQLLASRGAISNTNPFYSRLKGASSPVGREDFPTKQSLANATATDRIKS